MKLLISLILLGGFGFWMTKEIQHEQELQTQLDDSHQALQEAEKQIHAMQSQQQPKASRQSGISPNAQWMWAKDADNPLNAPATRGHGGK